MVGKTRQMTVDQLKAEVDRKVAEKLPSLLIDALITQHAKHGFRSSCQCEACQLKRSYIHKITWTQNWNRPHIVSLYKDSFQKIIDRCHMMD